MTGLIVMSPNIRSRGDAVDKVLIALWRRLAQLSREAKYMRGSITILVTVFILACMFNGAAIAGLHLTKQSSCSLLKKTVARLYSLPETGPLGAGWFCDFSRLSGNRWFVVALRSNRACSGDCSNLMGWYAINRRNGEIHSYDISKLTVGLRL
jgi:hypothetical protein